MNTKGIAFMLSGLVAFLVGAWYVYSGFFSLGAKLDNYIKAYMELGNFSGSVLVAKDGKVLLCKGYGMANYEHDIPNTPQTKFRLGSITKQFTAMAIMQLQERGLLSVNDTLDKYISDYPKGDKITINHLLMNTSGMPSVRFSPEYEKEKLKPHTIEQVIKMFKNKPLEFEPGEKYNYSDSGYVLLSYIIEKSSGKKYETILKENIFNPLNMRHSGYDNYKLIIKDRASGYDVIDDERVNATYIDMSFLIGSDALYSTVEDLYLWDQALYTEKLVSKKSLDQIFSPIKGEHRYGWWQEKLFNRKLLTCRGVIDGFGTDICRYPDDNVCIVVLSNFEDSPVTGIAKELATIVFGEKYELPQKRVAVSINPALYDCYVGKYKFKDNLIIAITKEDNKLFEQWATGGFKTQIYPESETKFFLKVVNAPSHVQISFVKDKNAKVSKLILHQGGIDQVAEKIE